MKHFVKLKIAWRKKNTFTYNLFTYLFLSKCNSPNKCLPPSCSFRIRYETQVEIFCLPP